MEHKPSNQAMQRTAGRPALMLSTTSTFNLQPHAPSPAVADLVLVRCDHPSIHSPVLCPDHSLRDHRLDCSVHVCTSRRTGLAVGIGGSAGFRVRRSLSVHGRPPVPSPGDTRLAHSLFSQRGRTCRPGRLVCAFPLQRSLAGSHASCGVAKHLTKRWSRPRAAVLSRFT
jgi:hypothetical protein